MEKPISLRKKELIGEIANGINNCGLPLFVISDVLENILKEVKTLQLNQEQKEEEEYQKFLEEQKTE